jgi:hypothetical protein
MAGDVTVQLVDGDLIVTGDALANAIILSDGELVGVFNDGGTPTNINGVPNGTFDYSGMTGDVVIRMLDGADRVSFGGAFTGAVVIESGDGNDIVSSGGGAQIPEELVIELGAGSNQVTLAGSNLDGTGTEISAHTVIIHGGEEADSIRISENLVSRDFVMNTRGGNDNVALTFVLATNFLGVDGGAGDDAIKLEACKARVISLRAGGGGGFVGAFHCETVEDLGMIGGDAPTNLRAFGCVIGSAAYLISGGANDYIQLENSRIRELQVNAGAGSDRLDISGSLLERVFAELGADSDLLEINNTAISGVGSLSGGEGFDVISGRGNAFGGATPAFFERFT